MNLPYNHIKPLHNRNRRSHDILSDWAPRRHRHAALRQRNQRPGVRLYHLRLRQRVVGALPRRPQKLGDADACELARISPRLLEHQRVGRVQEQRVAREARLRVEEGVAEGDAVTEADLGEDAQAEGVGATGGGVGGGLVHLHQGGLCMLY